MTQSKTDIAFEIIKENKGGLAFDYLWDRVCERIGLENEAKDDLISSFYTDLSLDGRFITLGDNVWDLRENNSFDKVHIDMNDIYSDDEEVIEVDEGLIAKEDTDERLFEDEVEKKEE
ncbi:DNA-directed RNA polymerase subunit delta [Bacilli bacterium PM5-3]|nr:DNA-directed RNA polymerase subunit delta [Bacilli bacterium PM5-3]MDH6603912.1 DNA-directed RNA polymerase subunit delta [Bacilli bacterium PM5-9]